MPSSRLVILPYKQGSQSAKRLAQALTASLGLKVRRVRPDGLYRPKLRSVVLNYGSSFSPSWMVDGRGRVLNHPRACTIAGNKLTAFNAFKAANLSIPEFTTERSVAEEWIKNGETVVCRTVLNGHSGRGIVLSQSVEQLVHAPLYVKYKKKKKEFRVHVFNGQVIDVSEKRRIKSADRPDTFNGFIRNHNNGWVFCRDGVVEPRGLRDLACSVCSSCGLDMGAVDIIWNEREDKCYVLEVNTAPGIEGTTLQNYTKAVLNLVRS